MKIKMKANLKTVGWRLKAWRKGEGFILMRLSRLIKVSQGSLSDVENENTLPSAKTLTGLALNTNLNVYWLLTGKGEMYQESSSMETTNQSKLYEDFLLLMQDKKLKQVVEKVIAMYKKDKKTKILLDGFIAGVE